MSEFGMVLWQGRGRSRRRGDQVRLLVLLALVGLAALAGAALLARHGSNSQVIGGAALVAPAVVLLAGRPLLALRRWFAT